MGGASFCRLKRWENPMIFILVIFIFYQFTHNWGPDERQDLVAQTKRTSSVNRKIHIAVGLSFTSKKVKGITEENIAEKFILFRTFLPSFCNTRSSETIYQYHFYVAFDYDDPYLKTDGNQVIFADTFRKVIEDKCGSESTVTLRLVMCQHSRKPAWAQNDALIMAYLENNDYYYRLNDDIRMTSRNWTEVYIGGLLAMDPPNVGVAVPLHHGGREKHVEFDFVHRTHVDIFGWYYPRVFMDLYGDKWIGEVYGPERTFKTSDVGIVHLTTLGKRYSELKENGGGGPRRFFFEDELRRDREKLARYLRFKRSFEGMKANGKRVIAMSADVNFDKTFGMIANTLEVKLSLPDWSVVVYISSDVPTYMVTKLKSLGVTIREPDPRLSHLPASLWKYSVLSEPGLEVVAFRDPAWRLTDRDVRLLRTWLDKDIHDHPVMLVRDGVATAEPVWATRGEIARLHGDNLISRIVDNVINDVTQDEDEIMMTVWDVIFWPLLEQKTICYDIHPATSKTCSHPMPDDLVVSLSDKSITRIGQKVDAFDTLPDFIHDKHRSQFKKKDQWRP